MFGWQRSHFIDELSRRGCEFDTFNPLLCNSIEEANEEIVSLATSNHYDLFFTNVCYEKMLYPNTLQEIKKAGIPTLSLRCDNLVIPYNDKELAPYFDLLWLTSKETQHLYEEWGAKTFFAPYAANPFTFKYVEKDILRKVCFIGTPYGSRSIMINSITSSGGKLDLYYGGARDSEKKETAINIIKPSRYQVIFNRLRFYEGRKILKGTIVNKLKGSETVKESINLSRFPAIAPSEISEHYAEYALSLASTSTNHTDSLKNPLKIVNLRNFEIPMSGGIEICKYNPELADYYEEDKEIVFYKDNDELVDKVLFYTEKAKEEDLRRIKLAARKRSESEHTWWNRFTIAFDKLGLKH